MESGGHASSKASPASPIMPRRPPPRRSRNEAAAQGPTPRALRLDTEGPAVFSRLPIVAADYALLSRDPADGGDGHQRVVLHALLDAGGGALVDVYTVHLALSGERWEGRGVKSVLYPLDPTSTAPAAEAARNRTVPELLAFIRASRRGSLQARLSAPRIS